MEKKQFYQTYTSKKEGVDGAHRNSVKLIGKESPLQGTGSWRRTEGSSTDTAAEAAFSVAAVLSKHELATPSALPHHLHPRHLRARHLCILPYFDLLLRHHFKGMSLYP